MVHSAAASNLGQMLVKLCLADGVPLVNIVRKPEQEELLRSLGAVHVCNSASSSFATDLTEALKATSATLAFDATGGGPLANQILSAMERAAQATTEQEYSPYGSSVHKQVYIYGALDARPVTLGKGFGLAWGVGGWLVSSFLASAGLETLVRLRSRVAAELTTTFELLQPRGVVGRHAPPRRVQVLRQAGDGGEVPPRAERRLRWCPAGASTPRRPVL